MKKNGFFSGIGSIALVILALGLSSCASNSPAPIVGWDSQNPPSRAAPGTTYTVRTGDTLYSIAREYGVDFRELIALNGIENPNQISVGRVLKIGPDPGAASSGVVTAPVASGAVVVRPIGESPLIGPGGNTGKLKREPKAGKEPYSDQALAAARSDGQPGPGTGAEASSDAAEKSTEKFSPGATAGAAAGLSWNWPSSGRIIGRFGEKGSKGIEIAGKAGDPIVAVRDGRVIYSGTGLRGYGMLVVVKHDATYLSAYAHNQHILVKVGQSVSKGQKIAEMGNTDADQVKLHFEIRRQAEPVDPLKYLPPR